MAENIKLGDRVKHRINGFTGIVTGITEYLQQCRQILITPEKLDKDGKVQTAHWYDEPWVDLVKAAVHGPKGAVTLRRKIVSGAPSRSHPAEREA